MNTLVNDTTCNKFITSIYDELKNMVNMTGNCPTGLPITNTTTTTNEIVDRILREQDQTVINDVFDRTTRWWVTWLFMKNMKPHEITYCVKKCEMKDQVTKFFLQIYAKRQTLTTDQQQSCKMEILQTIELPYEVDYECVRLIYTIENVLLIKVPFILNEEQKFNCDVQGTILKSVTTPLQRMLHNLNLNSYNPIHSMNQDNMNTICDFKENLINNPLTMLNGWGPQLTNEMKTIQMFVMQMIPLLRPHQVIPYFMKCQQQNREHFIVLDFVLWDIVRPQEIQITLRDNKITYEINTERSSLDKCVNGKCCAKETFALPPNVIQDRVQVKLMPNGHLRFLMPVHLTEKVHELRGETVPVRH